VSDVLGVVKAGSAFVRDGRGYASITLGSNAPAGIKEGTLRSISIGYAVNSMKRNGEAADGLPIYTVESYRILECSVVGVPADSGAEILRKFEAEIVG
jgi:phage head maturation protease